MVHAPEDPRLAKAKARAEQIRQGLLATAALIKVINEAWAEYDYEVLGYESWSDYCQQELYGKIQLPMSERAQVVIALRTDGMSQQAIAEALGTSRAAIQRVDAQSQQEGQQSPEDKTEVVQGERPGFSTGVDRKRYPRRGQQEVVDPLATESTGEELSGAEAFGAESEECPVHCARWRLVQSMDWLEEHGVGEFGRSVLARLEAPWGVVAFVELSQVTEDKALTTIAKLEERGAIERVTAPEHESEQAESEDEHFKHLGNWARQAPRETVRDMHVSDDAWTKVTLRAHLEHDHALSYLESRLDKSDLVAAHRSHHGLPRWPEPAESGAEALGATSEDEHLHEANWEKLGLRAHLEDDHGTTSRTSARTKAELIADHRQVHELGQHRRRLPPVDTRPDEERQAAATQDNVARIVGKLEALASQGEGILTELRMVDIDSLSQPQRDAINDAVIHVLDAATGIQWYVTPEDEPKGKAAKAGEPR